MEMRRAVKLALAPVACATVLTACAMDDPYATIPGAAAPAVVPAPLTTFDRLDANRDGFLSRGEIELLGVHSYAVRTESATSAFHRLDTNRDGFLSRAEADMDMRIIPSWSFDAADTNRDGFLSLAEAVPHLRWFETRGPVAYPSFEALDLDRDGFLTRAEADPLLRSAQWTNGRWVMAAPVPPVTFSFDRLDANRDGFVSRIEASGSIGSDVFDRHDLNRDGFLSRSEVDVMFRSNVGTTYSPAPAGVIIYQTR